MLRAQIDSNKTPLYLVRFRAGSNVVTIVWSMLHRFGCDLGCVSVLRVTVPLRKEIVMFQKGIQSRRSVKFCQLVGNHKSLTGSRSRTDGWALPWPPRGGSQDRSESRATMLPHVGRTASARFLAVSMSSTEDRILIKALWTCYCNVVREMVPKYVRK